MERNNIMKNLLLPEPQKTEHEVIIAEIETADKAKKGPTEFSKWSRAKLHIKRNKEKYVAGTIMVGAAIIASIVISNQDSEEEYGELCDDGWNDGGWNDGWEWDEDGDIIGKGL